MYIVYVSVILLTFFISEKIIFFGNCEKCIKTRVRMRFHKVIRITLNDSKKRLK